MWKFQLAFFCALEDNPNVIFPLELLKSAHTIECIQPSCHSGVWVTERTSRKQRTATTFSLPLSLHHLHWILVPVYTNREHLSDLGWHAVPVSVTFETLMRLGHCSNEPCAGQLQGLGSSNSGAWLLSWKWAAQFLPWDFLWSCWICKKLHKIFRECVRGFTREYRKEQRLSEPWGWRLMTETCLSI